jgi:hypothetical protein
VKEVIKMKGVEPVRRGCVTTNPNHTSRACSRGFTASVYLAILLVGAATCAASSGPGIGIKIGAQTLTDPVDLGKTTRARVDLEVSSPLILDDHLDFAFSLGGLSLGDYEDYYSDEVDGTLIEEYYNDALSVFDIRLAVRLYPLGDQSRLRPYVGAGVGYFWLHDWWEYERDETFEDPHFPGVYHTIVDEDEGSDTLADGFFPFLLAGLAVPLGHHGELMFEFQYDFEKEDNGFDVGGPIYMFGGRVRF